MQCPYCLSTIDDQALVCKVCSRDLYLFKPLTEKIRKLEERLQAQQAQEVLSSRITELEGLLREAHHALEKQPESMGRYAFNLGQFILIPLVLLLLGHALVTVVYDLPLLYLRILSMVLPLPFGFWLFRQRHRALLPWFLAVVGLALCSVMGMSTITAWVDRTPILPQNLLEWKEFLEYGASISFSFLTGMLLGGMAYMRSQRVRWASTVKPMSGLISQMRETGLSADAVQQIIKKLESYGATLVALGTTAMSIYTGLKSVM